MMALPRNVIARWKAEDWDDERMVASYYTYTDLATGEAVELTEDEAAQYYWSQTADDITGGCQAGTLAQEGKK